MTDTCEGCQRVNGYIDDIIVAETVDAVSPMAVLVMLIDGDGGVHVHHVARDDVRSLLGAPLDKSAQILFDSVNAVAPNPDRTVQ